MEVYDDFLAFSTILLSSIIAESLLRMVGSLAPRLREKLAWELGGWTRSRIDFVGVLVANRDNPE